MGNNVRGSNAELEIDQDANAMRNEVNGGASLAGAMLLYPFGVVFTEWDGAKSVRDAIEHE